MNAVQNMLRNFEQIDKPQPKVDFVPRPEDYCLMIDGTFDGQVYHHSTIVGMLNEGYVQKYNQKFVCMAELSVQELLQFVECRNKARK